MPEFVVSLNSPNLTMGSEGGSSEGAPGEALGSRMIELCLRLRLLAIDRDGINWGSGETKETEIPGFSILVRLLWWGIGSCENCGEAEDRKVVESLADAAQMKTLGLGFMDCRMDCHSI